MAPRSLVQICLRIAMENVLLITSVAGVPAHLVHAILRAVKSAEHLYNLELSDPEIALETGPHWQRIIRHDFPLLSKQLDWAPKFPNEWHKVYEKYKMKREADDLAATEALKKSFAAKQVEQHNRQATIVSSTKALRRLPQLPKDGRSSFGSRDASSSWGRSSGDGSRTKGDFFKKAKREARQDVIRRSISTPTGKLVVQPGQIKRAPESMINMKRIEQLPSIPPPPMIRAPRAIAQTDAARRERAEREARLLKIKDSAAASGPNILTFDDEEDRGETTTTGLFSSEDDDGHQDDEDDLFGDKDLDPPSPPSPPTTASDNTSGNTSSSTSAGVKRKRGGILSNAPGANSRTGGAFSPPRSANSAATAPRAKPTAAGQASSSSPPLKPLSDPPPAPPADRPRVVKKKAVDIFMRSNKRQKL